MDIKIDKVGFIVLAVVLIVFVSACAQAKTYYVDSKDGSDYNSGTSTSSPFKTIQKVNTVRVYGGDQILFKRGSVWHFPLDAYLDTDSGNSNSDMYYGAYGTGAKPEFRGSAPMDSSNQWTYQGSNIWKSADVSKYNQDVGNIILNHGQAVGYKKPSLSQVKVQNDFYYSKSEDKVYLYSTSNPADKYYSVELAIHRNIIQTDLSNYVTIENIAIKYSGRKGIAGGDAGGTHDITIKNCEVAYIGGSYQPYENQLRYGNGIEFAINVYNVLVTKTKVTECWDACASTQAWSSGGPVHMHHHEYSYNEFTNCAYGFEYFSNHLDSITNDLVVHHNTIAHNGNGWADKQGGNRGRGIQLNTNPPDSWNIIFRDNVIYENDFKAIDLGGGTATNWRGPMPRFYNNLYTRGPAYYYFGWKGVDYRTLPNFKQATGQENGGVDADAKLDGYIPRADSPACRMSTTGSYVGAYECQTAGSYCGDNVCNTGESCSSCSSDCGSCAENEHNWFEAEYGDIDGDMNTYTNSYASNDRYISAGNDGYIIYDINIEEPDEYIIWARVIGESGTRNSFYAKLDSYTERTWHLDIASYWNWQVLGGDDPVKLWLTSGNHKLRIRQREAKTKIDKILITNDYDYTPVDKGDTADNLPSFCGDGTCNTGETCGSCSSDCGSCNSDEEHWLEAELALDITGDLAINANSYASNSQYISAGDNGYVNYQVQIDSPGNYCLWGRVIGENGERNSFYAKMDSYAEQTWHLDINPYWNWQALGGSSPKTWWLEKGTHILQIKQREKKTKIDKLLLTNIMELTPTGLGEMAEN